jgi:hypothetical protein
MHDAMLFSGCMPTFIDDQRAWSKKNPPGAAGFSWKRRLPAANDP